MSTTAPDDLTPKERELQRYLIHLVDAHNTTDITGVPDCFQCANFKAALTA